MSGCRRSLVLVPLVVCLAVIACAKKDDTAPPVAAPTLTLDRTTASVGAPIEMTVRFVVAADAPTFAENYLVFVHFLDKDGELMWTDDHEPPVPTSQWKPGQTIEYARTIFVPKFPYVGETRVDIGIYSPKTGDRLPLAGQSVGQRAYRAATFTLQLQPDNVFVVFRDGWHEAEVAADGSQLEWQWSKKEGTVAFRNPKKDVWLYLQCDQPTQALGSPQHVEVRIGTGAVDTFDLAPGKRELRKVAVSAAQLGDAETVDMTIAVDKTFVPAATPALKSSDARELGIRVFRVYVQPR